MTELRSASTCFGHFAIWKSPHAHGTEIKRSPRSELKMMTTKIHWHYQKCKPSYPTCRQSLYWQICLIMYQVPKTHQTSYKSRYGDSESSSLWLFSLVFEFHLQDANIEHGGQQLYNNNPNRSSMGSNSESKIIIIFIYCNWVVTRWQWLFYVYTKHEIGYY